MLPGLDGLSLCRKLRQGARRDTPVLMLTARDTQQDKITGFETGADDYLVKPFDIRELAARVQALVRRRCGNVAAEVLLYITTRSQPPDSNATRIGSVHCPDSPATVRIRLHRFFTSSRRRLYASGATLKGTYDQLSEADGLVEHSKWLR